jgi:hypothetical protein
MPLEISHDQPTLLFRRAAFEQYGLTRAQFDDEFGLTSDEFRVEADLVAVGPLPPGTDVSDLISDLEARGLVYFDDFFDLSGNWPEWLNVFAMAARPSGASPRER